VLKLLLRVVMYAIRRVSRQHKQEAGRRYALLLRCSRSQPASCDALRNTLIVPVVRHIAQPVVRCIAQHTPQHRERHIGDRQ
jgi:hypothetical protein